MSKAENVPPRVEEARFRIFNAREKVGMLIDILDFIGVIREQLGEIVREIEKADDAMVEMPSEFAEVLGVKAEQGKEAGHE